MLMQYSQPKKKGRCGGCNLQHQGNNLVSAFGLWTESTQDRCELHQVKRLVPRKHLETSKSDRTVSIACDPLARY